MNCEKCPYRNTDPQTCKVCKQNQKQEVEKIKVTMFKGYNEVSLKNQEVQNEGNSL